MTARYDVTSILQREFVNDPALFGTASPGTEQEPGVEMENVHHIKKTVAGVPNLRPSWFFDINQQGEGLTDVGTHLVDLVPWILFPDQPLDYRTDIKIIAAKRWPTILTREEFSQVTGEPRFPDFLSAAVRDNRLEYACNMRSRICSAKYYVGGLGRPGIRASRSARSPPIDRWLRQLRVLSDRLVP